MASLLAKCTKLLICFAGHLAFGHIRTSTPFVSSIYVFSPQTGHFAGISNLHDFVMFFAIWGIIIFALYTSISSPIPSSRDLI